MAQNDAELSALEAFVPPLLIALEAVGQAQRHLHPAHLTALEAALAPHRETLAVAYERFTGTSWHGDLAVLKEPLESAAEHAMEALGGFLDDVGDPQAMLTRFRALRRQVGALEALYPLHSWLKPVSQFFLDEPVRGSEELLERIRAATVDAGSDVETGVIHYANEREHRGGFSLYVPEYWDSAKRWPLVVALHGGSGHGRDFLWTWLREARSRGFVVLSATARDRTWSIVDPDVDIDAQPMLANVRHVMERFNVHPEKVLLTGMSDGATYAMLHGLMEGVPYTHLAALSGVFHPVNMINSNILRAEGKPIYVAHGMLDWMFPIDVARMTRDRLTSAGAALVYREIADLSHTYARDENPRILRWFDPTLALPGESV
jgi:phospholipase/carboxylesterase